MLRFLAGAASCFLLLTGAFLLWQSRAEKAPRFPDAPAARAAGVSLFDREEPLRAPEATSKTREERRFSRADKDKNGRIEREELLGARRKAFAKLDINGNGTLSFEEWAVKTITKFQDADKNRDGWLSAAEYAATAPPPPKRKTCSCKAPAAQPGDNDQN